MVWPAAAIAIDQLFNDGKVTNKFGEILGFSDPGSEDQQRALEAWQELQGHRAMGPGQQQLNPMTGRPANPGDAWVTDEGLQTLQWELQTGQITPEQYEDFINNPQNHTNSSAIGSYDPTWDERIHLDRFEQGRAYDPVTEKFYDPGASHWAGQRAVDPGQSAWDGIDWDRAGGDAQLSALDYLSGELGEPVERRTAAAEAEWSRQQQMADQQARAHREAALGDLEMRGMGGGGAALGAALAGEQDRTGARHQAGLDYLSIVDALEAQERARRDGLAQTQAGIGRTYEDQQFGQQGAIATGRDAWGAFEAGLAADFQQRQADAMDKRSMDRSTAQQDVHGRNVDRVNEGDIYNIDRERFVSDSDKKLQHAEEINRASLPGTWFDREAHVAAGMSGQHQSMADAKRTQNDKTRDTIVGLVKGIGTAAAGGM